jgi:hypothetical protein
MNASPITSMQPEDSLVRFHAMDTVLVQAWDARVAHLLNKLPRQVQAGVKWLRYPPRKAVRLLVSAFLILGGILSILPVLGLWMLPLGLALMSDDIPWLKVWLEHAAQWIGRMWRRVRGRPAQS